MNRKEIVFDFVVKYKTDCYRAFKICTDHKGFNTKEGSLLIELARTKIGYSKKTWDGDIYHVLWKVYKSITIDGVNSPIKNKPRTGVVKSRNKMSWSIQFIGKPEKVIEALNANSEKMSGESKAEFDSALPHLVGLVNENFGYDYLVNLTASGHGQTGEKPSRQLTAKVELIYGVIV
jgi:hypothetical protein